MSSDQTSSGGADKRPAVAYASEQKFLRKYRAALGDRYGFALGWSAVRYRHYARQRVRLILAIIGLLLRHPRLTWARLTTAGPRRLRHEARIDGNDGQAPSP